ncbi:related to MIP1 - DNA-directed DNA polymerase gamma catalytic subunit, mitochondrial [Melanopsichium pennsylvanicum]|uniref:Mitochondrial DNA polymerase catalytic subunit n=2 Tax=Melanopsichium pennsylvanicum TaxID=63383 RepID=A0AAJ4XNR7_9BASI|nr:related to MIP1-DNA-directed DNA polymerase gamma catalytic subunit, mitochondrial [Melanopsichium pennsylvanicum 4]SNX85729.1 related to MIP1 - DNA-directed DNA polymerase gamma catalytic subunit, mitochondrial [Melanopsichium pennsylvanicum]
MLSAILRSGRGICASSRRALKPKSVAAKWLPIPQIAAASHPAPQFLRLQHQQKRWHAATPIDFPSLQSKIPHHAPSTKAAKSPSKNVSPKCDPLEIPRNQVGVQLLPRRLHEQLFPSTMDPVPPIAPKALNICRDHLSQHGLKASDASTLPQTSFDLPPLQGKDLAQHFWNLGRQVAQPWLGFANRLAALKPTEPPEELEEATSKASVEEDFRFEASEWLKLDPALRTPGHLKPVTWTIEPGWTKYPILRSEDGSAAALGPGISVPYPDKEDDMLVFDVETMVQEGPFPVMATAAGANAWYSWLSPWLLQRGQGSERKDHLIPLGPSGKHDRARLIVGHNVSYDRARTLEEYTLDLGSTRWLDTMSLHVATRGISSPQRPAWMKHNKAKAEKRAKKLLEQAALKEETRRAIENALSGLEYDSDQLEGLKLEGLALDAVQTSSSTSPADTSADAAVSPPTLDMPFSDDESDRLASHVSLPSSSESKWLEETSKNSLADVARLHRIPMKVSKSARNVFVDGASREEILGDVQHLLSYCASDVVVTHEIFRRTWPDFAARCPHPATMAGVFGLGSTFLPVDDEWIDYQRRCDEQFNRINDQVQKCLIDLAEKLRDEGTKDVSWSLAAQIAEEKQLMLDPEQNEPVFPNPDRKRAWWEDDPWYSQLDWTPKKPKKAKIAGDGASVSATPRSDFSLPTWYRDGVLRNKTKDGFSQKSTIAQQLLKLRIDGKVVLRVAGRGWMLEDGTALIGSNLLAAAALKRYGSKMTSAAGPTGANVLSAVLTSDFSSIDDINGHLRQLADAARDLSQKEVEADPQLAQLDWSLRDIKLEELTALRGGTSAAQNSDFTSTPAAEAISEPAWWPKWYWDLYKSATGELQVTIRSAIAPILLKISWRGCPLYRSREHGWIFRHDPSEGPELVTRQAPLAFGMAADGMLQHLAAPVEGKAVKPKKGNTNGKAKSDSDTPPLIVKAFGTSTFYKVPHSEGEGANVGSPFAKSFIAYFEDGTLQSQHPDEVGRTAAKTALDLNAQCSYWIAVRDRVHKQMVVWDDQAGTKMHYPTGASGARQAKQGEAERRKGLILPQVVSMGTVTRRAIENTWLTASNAKKNRVGSELKAMVKAPPGYSLVGADVDSEELWICSVMGDAQFGIHGATAVGWMTLEGTKALGTDLHSKTASILGTSRNQAKVFNYSRIYGAGIKHATHLLLKANPSVSNEEATQKAKELYTATKGQNTHTDEFFGAKFWFGGTESYVFNKLESIALSDNPKTPALDCGVTNALTKKYLGKVDFGNGRMSEEYMPSRINWVVQSSGVDYLHLLITAMEWLNKRYDIDARFMLSVHDEVRYLVKDEDKYRAALALQIANIWTRAMFAFKLQMDDLPLGCAFFAQVDIDKVLRKEADDPCVTPSHPEAIPVGVALDIEQILKETKGSLFKDGTSSAVESESNPTSRQVTFPEYVPSTQVHRSLGERGLYFLQAQASKEMAEIRALETRAKMTERPADAPIRPVRMPRTKTATAGNPVRGFTCASTKSRNAASKSKSFDEDAWIQTCAEDAESSKTVRRRRASAGQGSSMSSRVGSRPTSASRKSLTHAVPVKAGFCTSAPISQQAKIEATPVDVSLAFNPLSLTSSMPKPPAKKGKPFFRHEAHRNLILFQLYRPLLRLCPVSCPSLKAEIKRVMHKKKALTSEPKVRALISEACELLHHFQLAACGNAEASSTLAMREEALAIREHKLSWNKYWAAKVDDLKAPKRIPHHSGALLPPTIFNGPLPRYKPVQPVEVSMMIYRRRIARIKRGVRRMELGELLTAQRLEHDAIKEAYIGARGRAKLSEEWEGFEVELKEQLKEIQDSFARDQRRSEMVFDKKTLVLAKRARLAKKRVHLRNKYAQSMARWRAAGSLETP